MRPLVVAALLVAVAACNRKSAPHASTTSSAASTALASAAAEDDAPCTFRAPVGTSFDLDPLPPCEGSLEACTTACEKKDAAACTDVGERYRLGSGVARDPMKAFSFYEKACQGKEPAGCLRVAVSVALGSVPPEMSSAPATCCAKPVTGKTMLPAACMARWCCSGPTRLRPTRNRGCSC